MTRITSSELRQVYIYIYFFFTILYRIISRKHFYYYIFTCTKIAYSLSRSFSNIMFDGFTKKATNFERPRFHNFPASGGTESQSSFLPISLARLIMIKTTKHQFIFAKKAFSWCRSSSTAASTPYIESLLLRVYLSHHVRSIHLANFSGKLGNYNAFAVCLLVVIQILKLAHFSTHVRLFCVRFSFYVSMSVLKMHLFIVFKRLLLKKKSWKEPATEIIVYRGDWLWKSAKIKVENNGAVGYVRSSLTVHNPFFFCL